MLSRSSTRGGDAKRKNSVVDHQDGGDDATQEPPQKSRRESSSKVETATVPESRTCIVCYDQCPGEEGFSCPQKCGTFTCWTCLQQSYAMATEQGAIKGTSNEDGELLCSDIKCRSPIQVLDLVKENASEALIKAHIDFTLHVHTTKRVSDALLEQERQIRAEYARIEQIKDVDEKAAVKLRLKIVNEALTLRCPRCSAAFVDFDGCFALRCGRNSCGCGFCAWCLEDCGYDAHKHVVTCSENPKKAATDAYFNTEQAFKQHHKAKRTIAVQRLIREAELSKSATEQLKTLIKRDLEDLGIEPGEVFVPLVPSLELAIITPAASAPAVAHIPVPVAAAAAARPMARRVIIHRRIANPIAAPAAVAVAALPRHYARFGGLDMNVAPVVPPHPPLPAAPAPRAVRRIVPELIPGPVDAPPRRFNDILNRYRAVRALLPPAPAPQLAAAVAAHPRHHGLLDGVIGHVAPAPRLPVPAAAPLPLRIPELVALLQANQERLAALYAPRAVAAAQPRVIALAPAVAPAVPAQPAAPAPPTPPVVVDRVLRSAATRAARVTRSGRAGRAHLG